MVFLTSTYVIGAEQFFTMAKGVRDGALTAFELMKYVKPLNLFDELLKRKATERGRFLGLDVGDKYIGLAISDPKNKKASPLSVLLRKKNNIDSMADKFQTLISEHNLVGLIVGYPFNRNRTTTDGAQVKLFIDNLSNTGKLEGLKYTYWEEGFTSKIVELLLKNLNLPQVMSKTITDKFAAAGILQGYLDKANNKVKLKGTKEEDYE
ncbi:hypothetical protein JRO89_XS15G0084100 [Xanthoceras sorbifolium]|uniref:YqgF/RNase H-like domain-containing protein n=1 Tax=Xanthoceras sorbifolium TaxID=99658 RepID=A0ABQ8H1D3_9ROSI|nr:hypothetical protein JRO89_XS15G0084100 [Xanthoceras sorbifolium]